MEFGIPNGIPCAIWNSMLKVRGIPRALSSTTGIPQVNLQVVCTLEVEFQKWNSRSGIPHGNLEFHGMCCISFFLYCRQSEHYCGEEHLGVRAGHCNKLTVSYLETYHKTMQLQGSWWHLLRETELFFYSTCCYRLCTIPYM